ncbi:MAG: hypothetical protein WC884_04240 [Candidatus Paceibacterota bacterium]
MRRNIEKTRNLVSIELLKKGFWVSTNPKDKKAFNVLCSNADMTKHVGIRVSQSSTTSRTWLFDEDIKYFPDDIFYILVGYKKVKSPEFFIVPLKTILDYTNSDNEKWLSTPRKKDGKLHKNINTRRFIIKDDERKKYLNRWDLLGL